MTSIVEPITRRAQLEDIPILVEVLARAFDDDPVPNFLFRGDRRRRRGLRRFFQVQLRHMYMTEGEVWTTGQKTGAALWAPPSKSKPGLRDLLRLISVAPDLVALGRRAGAALELLRAVDQARPKQDHWYLATIGTDPGHQGRGIGSALISKVLERVDLEGYPAYLESSKERNLAFYARHGFELTGKIEARMGGPTLWLMWREPKAREI